MKSIRRLAAEALMKVSVKGAWSNLALDEKIQKYKISGRDAAFFSALLYGVLERMVTLDACIAAHSKTPVEKLSKEVLVSLRMGVYQLLYMDSVPDHAAVDESVELVKSLGKANASGFVNGVLRSFLRAGKLIPEQKGPLQNKLSVAYSCPGPIVKLWLDSYGEEFTKRALSQSLGPPPVYIRVNMELISSEELVSRLSRHGVNAIKDSDIENCLLIENFGAVYELPEFKRGFFHVQDKSSQICSAYLGAAKGDRVLDACAAPGGKSFTIAQLMNGGGEVIAADIHPQRAALIKMQADKMKLKNIKAITMDSTVFDSALGTFDKIICDAPCSGLGVIRRKPEIKLKNPGEFTELPKLQYSILSNVSRYLKPGGRLVYSTCTLNPDENERVAQKFLDDHTDFEISGEFITTPLLDGSDGFFMAAFERMAPLEQA